jgi:hypothetical protein
VAVSPAVVVAAVPSVVLPVLAKAAPIEPTVLAIANSSMAGILPAAKVFRYIIII